MTSHDVKFVRPSTKGTLTFDFAVCWSAKAGGGTDIIELDGDLKGGHFDDDPLNQCPQRDLENEEWTVGQDKFVMRVLQEDVYRGRYSWEAYLLRALQECRERREAGQPARVATPDAPLYRSLTITYRSGQMRRGVYALLRQRPVAGANGRETDVAAGSEPRANTTAAAGGWRACGGGGSGSGGGVGSGDGGGGDGGRGAAGLNSDRLVNRFFTLYRAP